MEIKDVTLSLKLVLIFTDGNYEITKSEFSGYKISDEKRDFQQLAFMRFIFSGGRTFQLERFDAGKFVLYYRQVEGKGEKGET